MSALPSLRAAPAFLPCLGPRIRRTIETGLTAERWRRTLLICTAVVGGWRVQAQVTWNFTDGTGGPSSLASNITGGIISATNPSNGSIAFNSTSASSGYTGSSGGNNAVVTAKTGTLSTATSTYFEFTVTPASGYAIEATGLTLGSRSTGSGPTTLTLFSSVDNYASSVVSTSVSANSTWASVTLTSFSVAGATDASVTFRLYGSGGSGTIGTGNWRIDDLSLTASAIPEPSTYAAICGVLALAGAVVHRRKKAQPD